jgi:hypothetical protein
VAVQGEDEKHGLYRRWFLQNGMNASLIFSTVKSMQLVFVWKIGPLKARVSQLAVSIFLVQKRRQPGSRVCCGKMCPSGSVEGGLGKRLEGGWRELENGGAVGRGDE